MSASEPRSTVLRPGITLYLVRHGETNWNREQRYQGQRDLPLNETGRQQALANGRTLKSLMPEIASADFVSSPLDRAVDTMQLMRGEMGLSQTDFRRDPQLLELNYGHWEGELASELAKSDPIGVAAKAADPFGWRPRGGESYADLMTRIAAWLTTLDRDTIAVTHGGVSRVARGAILGLDERDVPFLDVPQDKILYLRNGEMRWL